MASLGSVFDRDILLRTINANPERLTPIWTSGAFNTSGQFGYPAGAVTILGYNQFGINSRFVV